MIVHACPRGDLRIDTEKSEFVYDQATGEGICVVGCRLGDYTVVGGLARGLS